MLNVPKYSDTNFAAFAARFLKCMSDRFGALML